MQTLRVIAAPGHLVADDVAYQGGARFRFVGRSPTPHKVPNPENLETRFPPTEREYPDDNAHRYLRRALQKGSILPCDKDTAKIAGVEFDPKRVEEIRRSVAPAEPPKKDAPKAVAKTTKGGDA
jgi:hypothetical protein